MAFDQSFRRQQGAASSGYPALGSDPNPSTLTGAAAAAYATRTNVFTFQLVQAGPQPLHLALGVQFVPNPGSGAPGAFTITLFLWDPDQTGTWLTMADLPATGPIGEVVVVDVPVVQSGENLQWQIAAVLSVAAPTNGVYQVVAGLTESAVTAGNSAPATVTANQGLPNGGGAASWPTVDRSSAATGGAAPSFAMQIGVSSGGTFVGLTEGQALMAASLPVVIASNQSAVPVSGTVTANQGTSPWVTSNPTQLPAALVGGRLDENVGSWLGSTAPTVGSKTSANSLPVVIASDQGAVSVNQGTSPWVTSNPTQLPAALVGGRLDENVGSWLGSTAPTVGSKTSANSIPVVIASDQGSFSIAVTQSTSPWVTADSRLPSSLGQTTAANSLPVVLPLASTVSSLTDITVSNGSTTTPGSLAAGPTGILFTAHPSNTSGSRLRVSGTDVSATQGQPFVAGGSYTWSVTNANVLRLTAETGGGGSGTACLTAV